MITELVNWAQIVATLFAGGGLILTGIQISRSIKQRRIERVDQVRKELFGDKELRSIYYKMEYSKLKYSSNFHGSLEEIQLDRLLSIFDSVAKQVEMKLLKISDLDLIAYEYLITYQNTAVREYMEFLDSWFEVKKIPRPAFIAFREIGQKLENQTNQEQLKSSEKRTLKAG